MKSRYLAWVLVPVLVAILAFAARRYTQSFRTLIGWDPVIECPVALHLGERELGEIVLSRFSIANQGRRPLKITNVHSSCACTGLEQECDNEFVRVTALRL